MSEFYGTILFSTEVIPQSIQKVLQAATHAGISPDEVHAIKPRNAFIRAVRELKRRGYVSRQSGDDILLHRFKDDEVTIEFQFSRTFLQDNGVRYDKAAVVIFDKKSHELRCESYDVLEFARTLYKQVQELYRAGDLHALVKRLIEKAEAKRIPLRDGVYFIAAAHSPVADKIKKFFEYLGLGYFLLPVGANTGEHKNLVKATVADINNTVNGIRREIEALKADNKLTSRIAKQRLKELQRDLKAYKEVARSLGEDIKGILDAAGDAGRTLMCTTDGLENLVSVIQKGSPTTSLLFDLVEAAEPDIKLPSRPVSAPLPPAPVLETVSGLADL